MDEGDWEEMKSRNLKLEARKQQQFTEQAGWGQAPWLPVSLKPSVVPELVRTLRPRAQEPTALGPTARKWASWTPT